MNEIEIPTAIAKIASKHSTALSKKILNIGEDALKKLQVHLETCYRSYLERTYDRYSKTKTILYKDPVSLRDFYVDATLVDLNHSPFTENEFIDSIIRQKRIILSSSAGTGKSSVCKSILMRLTEEDKGILPIFIELRDLNSQKDSNIKDFIVKKISDIDSKFTTEHLEYSLKIGKILLILDGYDEIDINNKRKYEKEIVSLSSTHQNIHILISTRPDSNLNSWEEFYNYEVMPLSKESSLELISKIKYDPIVKEKFYDDLDKKLFETHQSFASNPLLLTMMLITYEQFAEIPSKIHLFYEQAFIALFIKHDSSKSLYKRQSNTGLPIDQFKKILSAFCISSYLDSNFSFTKTNLTKYVRTASKISGIKINTELFLRDLLDVVCMLQKDGSHYTFTHRSFQEYFSAIFVSENTEVISFELLNQIAKKGDRDNVLSMLKEINQDALEKHWVIPTLKKIIRDFSLVSNDNHGKLVILSMMINSLRIIRFKDNKTVMLDPMSRRKGYFQSTSILCDLYPAEYKKIANNYRRTKRNVRDTAIKDMIRLDFGDLKNVLNIKNDVLNGSNATKNRILKSGACDIPVIRVNLCRELLGLLDSRTTKKI